jgi:heptosyltransferase I
VNQRLPARPRAHTQDQFLEFLELLDIPKEPLEWSIEFSPEETRAQADFLRAAGERPVVAVVPASKNYKKDWLASRYARVVDALHHDMGAYVVLVGGPSAREQSITAEILAQASARPVVALGNDVRRMMWLVAGSDLVIAPDTGPVHIARACNVPVIGLYGHTNPWRVGPYRKYTDLWVDCYTDPGSAPDPGNAMPKLGRMEKITVAMVLEKVELALRCYRREPRG